MWLISLHIENASMSNFFQILGTHKVKAIVLSVCINDVTNEWYDFLII